MIVRTYRLNGDNMDYTEKPQYQSSESGNKSKHYFQAYAVKDRIDFSHLSTQPPDIRNLSKEDLCCSMLPSQDDDEVLPRNFVMLFARVLCDNVPYFKHTYDGVVKRHIKHPYSVQMSSKSTVVCHLNTYQGASTLA